MQFAEIVLQAIMRNKIADMPAIQSQFAEREGSGC